MFKHLIIMPILLLPYTSLSSEDFTAIHNTNQVIGCWKKINFPESVAKKMNKIDPYPLPYQWYCFFEGGAFFSMHSNNEESYSTSQLIEESKIFPSVEEYSIPSASLIVIDHKEAKQTTNWVSSIIASDWPLAGIHLKEGDLLMTIRNPNTGQDVYSRFLTKIK